MVVLAVWSDQLLRRHRTYLHQSLDFIALMGLLVLLFAHLPALYFGRGAFLMIGGVGLILLVFSSPRHVYRCRLLADACGGTGTLLGRQFESLGVYRALVESSGLVSVSLAPWITPAPPLTALCLAVAGIAGVLYPLLWLRSVLRIVRLRNIVSSQYALKT